MRAIHVEGIRFAYGGAGGRPALDGVSFDVEKGEVFGVLGPNGAGKTTLMKILSTVYVASEGHVEILGHRLPGEEDAVRRRLGVAFAEFERAFSFRLTGRQNLEYAAALYGMPRRGVREAVTRALSTVGLAEKADTMVLAYSTGMKHRLSLARALLPAPDVLVLDEPTAGLDAQTTRELGATLRGLARGGVTILYTTHRLEEAGALCDRVLVLKDGRVAAMASPVELAQLASEVSAVELETQGVLPDAQDDVRALPGVLSATLLGRSRLRVQTRDVDATVEALVGYARKHGLPIASLTTTSATLADAFVAITEGRIRGGAA